MQQQDVLRPLLPTDVQVADPYWDRYTKLIREKTLPYQWEVLHDRVVEAAPSHCMHNFRIAAGEATGKREGEVFQDSDLYKWLEAVAYCLAAGWDETLLRQAEEAISLVARAQRPDGYLNTYYTLIKPEWRWRNLTEGHELYCAGHLLEAAVAYHQATGRDNLLGVACRFADLIDATFAPDKGGREGYPGHPELELALVRLYHETGNQRYLYLAKHFLDVRGVGDNFFLREMQQPGFVHVFPEFSQLEPAYLQSHLPVRSQTTAEGHAVRAVYLYAAMADALFLSRYAFCIVDIHDGKSGNRRFGHGKGQCCRGRAQFWA